jgi:hypothetical protein
MTSGLIGDGDAWLFVWNIWWARFAFLHDLGLFCSDYIHYPTGVCAYLHTWVFSVIWPSIPLQSLFSPIVIYNLFTLASFPLAAFGLFRFCRTLGLSFRASLLAGIAFSFTPYHFTEATGHLNLVSYQWIPFFLTSYMRGLTDGWSARRVAGAAAWLLLVALTDWYYFAFCLVAMGLLWLARTTYDSAASLRRAAGAALVAALVVLALSPILIGMITQVDEVPQVYASQHLSPDLASFVTPGPSSSYSDVLMRWWPGWSRIASPASTPWMLLLLVPFGVGRLTAWNRRWLLFWIPCFFVLSLGPALHFNGQLYDRVMLPFALLEKLPGLFLLRVPLRFHIMTLLGLSILCGLGVDRVAGATRWRAPLLAVALLVESAAIPFGLSEPQVSAFYRRLPREPGALRLIDLNYNSRALFYQTIHHQRLLGLPGMVSRQTKTSVAFLNDTLGVRELLDENRVEEAINGSAALGLERARMLAEKADVGLVVLGSLMRDGLLEVTSDPPHTLRLNDDIVATDSTRSSAQVVTRGRRVLLALRLHLRKGIAPTARISVRLNGEELDENSASVQALIPTVRLPMRNVGLTSVLYRDFPDATFNPASLTEIRRQKFDWVIVPFYGNDHYVRSALGLKPEYSDRWLEAFRVGE